jgi:cholesterol transport system auxiliary component
MKKLSLLALAAASAGLAGCVSLLPKSEPVQLYRLSPPAAAAQAGGAPETARIDVALAPTEFPRAAAGDRILTFTGPEAAYIADARWVAPAQILFAEALDGAFSNQARNVRLQAGRGEHGAPLVLDLDVREFAARYDNGGAGAPTIVLSMDAKLVRFPDRKLIGERSIRVEQRATENRVRAIVPAYQAAMDQALGELVGWTDATATAAAAQAQR